MNICLSMIVKNEAHVIERVLTSVLPLIDSWIVVDTGSTDTTREIVQAFFDKHGLPGKLLHFAWTGNFSEARNVALGGVESSGADYGFWIDADEKLHLAADFDKQRAFAGRYDSYSINTHHSTIEYTRQNIWKTGLDFAWHGPVHELLMSKKEKTCGLLENAYVQVHTDGASWSDVQQKYASHAQTLAAFCAHTPDPRWVFYAAQSYRDAGLFLESLRWYTRRASMTEGFVEERYMAKCAIARLSDILRHESTIVQQSYLDAHAFDPIRGEAIKGLTQRYMNAGDWATAYIYSKYGLRYNRANPAPKRILFLDAQYYAFEALEMHALAAHYAGHKDEAAATYWTMRDQIAKTGEDHVGYAALKRIKANEQFYPKRE